MLKSKGDTTCIKLIDFGLSKDYSGLAVMSTPSGSVGLNAITVFSLTTLRQKSSSRITRRR